MSSAVSIRESTYRYIEENSRTYHAFNSGSVFNNEMLWCGSYYNLQPRIHPTKRWSWAGKTRQIGNQTWSFLLLSPEDLQHHLFLQCLDGALHLAPLPSDIHNILNIETGTELLAVEFGMSSGILMPAAPRHLHDRLT